MISVAAFMRSQACPAVVWLCALKKKIYKSSAGSTQAEKT